MDIRLIRMHSGEELVAELIEDKGDTFVLSNPIVMVPGRDGNIGFAPWCPLAAEDVKSLEVRTSYMVFVTTPNESVIQNYTEIFSPIITPKGAGKIIT